MKEFIALKLPPGFPVKIRKYVLIRKVLTRKFYQQLNSEKNHSSVYDGNESATRGNECFQFLIFYTAYLIFLEFICSVIKLKSTRRRPVHFCLIKCRKNFLSSKNFLFLFSFNFLNKIKFFHRLVSDEDQLIEKVIDKW